MIVILGNIRSAHNVGSIFRTADAFGAEKIYLCGVTPAPIDKFGRAQKEMAKVALGAEKNIPWEKNSSTLRIVKKLKKEGCKIFAVEQNKNSIPLEELVFSSEGKAAFIMGNEVEGIGKKILKEADGIIEIPMFGTKESLNVSVAFGIVSYAWKMSAEKRRKNKMTNGHEKDFFDIAG